MFRGLLVAPGAGLGTGGKLTIEGTGPAIGGIAAFEAACLCAGPLTYAVVLALLQPGAVRGR